MYLVTLENVSIYQCSHSAHTQKWCKIVAILKIITQKGTY